MRLLLLVATIIVGISFGLVQTNAMYKQVLDSCTLQEDVSVTAEIESIERQISDLNKLKSELLSIQYESLCTYTSECDIERFDTETNVIGCYDISEDVMYDALPGIGCMYGDTDRRNVYNITQEQAQTALDAGWACEDLTLIISHCNREGPSSSAVHSDGHSKGECGVSSHYHPHVKNTMYDHYVFNREWLESVSYDYHKWIWEYNSRDRSRLEGVIRQKNFYNAYYK